MGEKVVSYQPDVKDSKTTEILALKCLEEHFTNENGNFRPKKPIRKI